MNFSSLQLLRRGRDLPLTGHKLLIPPIIAEREGFTPPGHELLIPPIIAEREGFTPHGA